DYWGKFKEVLERVTPSVDARSLVGSWTATSASISFAKEGEEAKLRCLKEICPDFSEVGEPVPWQEIGKRHAALEKDYRKSFKNLAAAFSRIRPDVVFGRTSSGQLMCCFG
ncbi:MAG: hypothetical protein IKX21_04410, partial [Deltaproteobacteria bacterium]|nr:hypothetical protein [Deltaproteobacteria bacterium]